MSEYISDAPNAPKAVGPYSQAVISGNFVFLSGQIALDPHSTATPPVLVGPDITSQTNQVLKNLTAVLARVGLTFNDVVKTTIFLTDLANFKAVNQLYEAAVGNARPARSTIQVAGLPLGAIVEIEMIAAITAAPRN